MASGRLSAVIAGGGIGGLATAIALSQRGVDVRVCERRVAFPEEGAGIQIGPNGARVLAELGVEEFVRDKVARPDALIVHDGATGRELARFPLGDWIEQRHGAPYWTLHRRDLHHALRRRAEGDPRIVLSPGNEIVGFANDPEGVTAEGMNGEEHRASLLVAADGLWSRLRTQISGSAASLHPVGKTAFRSVAGANALPRELASNAVHIWLTAGAHAVHYPVNGGRDVALVVIADSTTADEGWDRPAAGEAVKQKTGVFAAPFRSLVERAPEWRQWSLYRTQPLARWASGRAALLGDAAHPILPFFAQGAVMALEDAATLAARVASSNGDIASSLSAYEMERRPRLAKVAAASVRNGRVYHMSGPAAFARDTVLRMRSGARIMAGFDWLYGWRL